MAIVCDDQGNDRDPGKFIRDEGTAKVGRDGWEVQIESFDWLVVRREGDAAGREGGPREALAQRGEKLEALGSASERLADEGFVFLESARELREQSESKAKRSWLPF